MLVDAIKVCADVRKEKIGCCLASLSLSRSTVRFQVLLFCLLLMFCFRFYSLSPYTHIHLHCIVSSTHIWALKMIRIPKWVNHEIIEFVTTALKFNTAFQIEMYVQCAMGKSD